MGRVVHFEIHAEQPERARHGDHRVARVRIGDAAEGGVDPAQVIRRGRIHREEGQPGLDLFVGGRCDNFANLEGRLDEVFRSITMPDTAKEAA